jgi:hypothetical protein
MARRTGFWVLFVLVVLLLLPLAGCSGGDDPEDDEAEKAVKAEKAVAGSFVGEVSGTKAFVAVVVAPAAGEKDARAVQVYVSDGRRLSQWFSGSISNNSFVAKSDDGETEAKGKLSSGSVTGTVELPGGKTLRYVAGPPSGAAGLYEVTVSSEGELSGASAAGLGVTGEVTMRRRGTGMLRLVDGKRLEFDVTRNAAGDLIPLRAGQVRLIVLASGQLRGAGKSRPSAGGGDSDFFVRSSS